MKDLKVIKDKYGEDMMHFSRKYFSTILEKDNLLPSILLSKFYPNKYLYNDIIKYNLKSNFIKYIYFLVDKDINKELYITNKNPYELLNEVGYNLYECKANEDVLYFKKYYKEKEELCTFNDSNRIKNNYIFFAVKKDVDKIKREDYKVPNRQDLYGTSVISIQINKETHTLSIKNRYNHTVNNPDATFSNNLDNIVKGLTKSFEDYLSIKIDYIDGPNFEIPNYVIKDKYYKYNYEINNIYYCIDNIVIDNNKITKYDKSKYILMDNYLLDIPSKEIKCIDGNSKVNIDINSIKVVKHNTNRLILINNDILIEINDLGNIIKIIDYEKREIKDNFLCFNSTLEYLEMPNARKVGNNFLDRNNSLKYLLLDNVKEVKDNFLSSNNSLSHINLPNLLKVGDNFLERNNNIKYLTLNNLKHTGNNFMSYNNSLEKVYLPNLEEIGRSFLMTDSKLKEIYIPNLKYYNLGYLDNVEDLELIEINKDIGKNFISNNYYLKNNCKKLVLK